MGNSAFSQSGSVGTGTVQTVIITTANGVSGVSDGNAINPALTFTLGAITPSNVLISGQTANRVASFDSSKNVTSLDTATYPSLTELSYVKGVTSAIQAQINGLAGALTFKGTWNASTNSPTLTSSVGTTGFYYTVSVAGSTNLDGISTWLVGDLAVFNGSVWQRVVGSTTVQSVTGTSNRITSTGGVTPVIDISSAYVGQNTITTTGTLVSGATGAGFTLALGTSTLTGVVPFANLSLVGLVEEINFQDETSGITAHTYTLSCYAHYGFTINTLKIICTSGTATAAIKINGTAVTNISAVGVSSTIATGTASGANTVVVGDIITLVISSPSSLNNLKVSLKITRT